ncbi:MAG: hypothetical protein ACXW2T_02680 [Allosphingosinicella sp.]
MKKLILVAAIALSAGCTAASADEVAEMEANSEAKLAAELRDYEQAGPPVSCVSQRDLGGNRSAGDAIVFDGKTSAVRYVNRPAGGCPDLNFGRALIIRTTGSQLCRGDIATVFDPVSQSQYGGCGLGDFTPYRRIASR